MRCEPWRWAPRSIQNQMRAVLQPSKACDLTTDPFLRRAHVCVLCCGEQQSGKHLGRIQQRLISSSRCILCSPQAPASALLPALLVPGSRRLHEKTGSGPAHLGSGERDPRPPTAPQASAARGCTGPGGGHGPKQVTWPTGRPCVILSLGTEVSILRIPSTAKIKLKYSSLI